MVQNCRAVVKHSFKDSDFAMHLLKVLKKRDSLRDHKRTHTGEKPFFCRSEAYKYFIKVSQILVADKKTRLNTFYTFVQCTCFLHPLHRYCPYRGSSSSLLAHHKHQRHKAEFLEEKSKKAKAREASMLG